MKTNLELLKECCRALAAREANYGDWNPPGIPKCFFDYRDRFLPNVRDEISWLSVVMSSIERHAVREIAKL